MRKETPGLAWRQARPGVFHANAGDAPGEAGCKRSVASGLARPRPGYQASASAFSTAASFTQVTNTSMASSSSSSGGSVGAMRMLLSRGSRP